MRVMHKRLMQGMDDVTGRMAQVERGLERSLDRLDDLQAGIERVGGGVGRAADALERAVEVLARDVVPALREAVAGLERQAGR